MKKSIIQLILENKVKKMDLGYCSSTICGRFSPGFKG